MNQPGWKRRGAGLSHLRNEWGCEPEGQRGALSTVLSWEFAPCSCLTASAGTSRPFFCPHTSAALVLRPSDTDGTDHQLSCPQLTDGRLWGFSGCTSQGPASPGNVFQLYVPLAVSLENPDEYKELENLMLKFCRKKKIGCA